MASQSHSSSKNGFTLIELICVMVIIALMAAMLAPSMTNFAAGRGADNTARRIAAMAQYARAQSISEARTYRLNFDESSQAFWLTADDGGGVFNAANNEWGQKFAVPNGITVRLENSENSWQSNINMNVPASIQQVARPQPNNGMLLNGQQGGTVGQTMVNVRPEGQEYIEFQPSGRTDPASIWLTDDKGRRTELWCGSPSEKLVILAPGVTR